MLIFMQNMKSTLIINQLSMDERIVPSNFLAAVQNGNVYVVNFENVIVLYSSINCLKFFLPQCANYDRP
jgi:hypothetical protein